MLRYNLNKQFNNQCKGNEGQIKKNEQHMTTEEKTYIKTKIKKLNIGQLTISKHALEKELLNLNDIKMAIKSKQYKIIDFNYYPHNHEERVLIRTKNKYQIENTDTGLLEESYIKIVISLKTLSIITVWGNRCVDEKEKNNGLGVRYIQNFDIINKKIKLN